MEARIAEVVREAAKEVARPVVFAVAIITVVYLPLLSLEGVATFRQQCTHAQFVDIADAGHMVVGDRNDAFTAAVIDFVDQLGEDDRRRDRVDRHPV